MGATVMSANLKIKFDVFIEIRGRSAAPHFAEPRGVAAVAYTYIYKSVILHVLGSRGILIAQLRMMDLNSNVTVRRM